MVQRKESLRIEERPVTPAVVGQAVELEVTGNFLRIGVSANAGTVRVAFDDGARFLEYPALLARDFIFRCAPGEHFQRIYVALTDLTAAPAVCWIGTNVEAYLVSTT